MKILKSFKEKYKWSYNRDFVWGTALMWASYVLAFLTAFNIAFEIYEAFRYNEWYDVITDIILWTSVPILVYVGSRNIRENASEEKSEYTRINNLFEENCRIAALSPFDKRFFLLEREMEQAIATAAEEDRDFIEAYYKNRIGKAKSNASCNLLAEEKEIIDCLHVVFDEIIANPTYSYLYLKATVYPLFKPELMAVDGCLLVHLFQKGKEFSVILSLPVNGVYDVPVTLEGCCFMGGKTLDENNAFFDNIKIEPFGLFLTNLSGVE